jgi:signal transduction histidine kinase
MMQRPPPPETIEPLTSVGRHLASAPMAFAVTEGPKHTLLFANAAFQRLRRTGEISIGPSADVPAGAEPADIKPMLDLVFRTAKTVRDARLAPPGQGATAWSCTVWPVDAAAKVRKLVIEVRDIELIESERAWQRSITERLLLGALRAQDNALDARGASTRAQFLARVSRDLSLSLDEEATRETVRRLTLLRPGTWCIVDIVQSNGLVRRLAVEHPDPAKQALARQLHGVWPAPDTELSDGDTFERLQRARDATGRALLLAAHGEENLRILREIGFGAILVVPLMVRAHVHGSITFVSQSGDPPFTPEEVSLSVDLAARSAMALDNARLYRESDVLRRAAEAASLSKTQFIGGMSHELRTPLNAIGGFADLMDLEIQGPVTPEQRESLNRIRVNQQHLIALITELLTVAQGEPSLQFHNESVALKDAIAEVTAMLSGAARKKRLTLEGPGECSATAWADAKRVRQILINLVMNALKYTPNDGGVVSVSCATAGEVVRIEVRDHGPGIPADKLDLIFDPFVQLTADPVDRQGGVGLGLAISRDLARGMRGELSVASVLGEGSCFTLTLPRAPEVRAASDDTERAAASA